MNTVNRAKRALWKKSGLPHDPKGYVEDARLILVSGVTPEMIKTDYCDGSGQEWLAKIRAIHSSAALVANTFGRWKTDLGKLKLLGLSGFQALKLEAKCSTGLRGTPPNLDVLLQSSDGVIGIESKLLEPLTIWHSLVETSSYIICNFRRKEKEISSMKKNTISCHSPRNRLVHL